MKQIRSLTSETIALTIEDDPCTAHNRTMFLPGHGRLLLTDSEYYALLPYLRRLEVQSLITTVNISDDCDPGLIPLVCAETE